MSKMLRPCGIVVALLIYALPVWADGPAALPRYKLEVGQEIEYALHDQQTYDGGAFLNEAESTLWVVRRNDDGSFRLVVRETSTFTQQFQGKSSPRETEEVQLAYFDLYPDGRYLPNQSVEIAFHPGGLFPRLPANADEAQKGWTVVHDDIKTQDTPLPAQDTAKQWVFESVPHSPSDDVYLSASTNVFHFDLERGLMVQCDLKGSQGYGFKGQSSGSVELKSVQTKDAAWITQLADESTLYFNADAARSAQAEAAEQDPRRAVDIISKADDALRAVRPRLTLKLLQDAADQTLSSHDIRVKYARDSATRFGAILDKPAADWKLNDLDGKPHSLADYRGKVVVLDFWYRGCGWCMKAMPQMKQVAEDFKNQDVAILGMNTDADVADPKLVVEKMGLTYQTLRADQNLPEKYGVRGFPTLIVIDQQGIVRGIHVGYSPHLRQSLDEQLQKLLTPAPATQPASAN